MRTSPEQKREKKDTSIVNKTLALEFAMISYAVFLFNLRSFTFKTSYDSHVI